MALSVECPVCRRGPGQWCVYVGKVMRSGRETKRLHVERTHQLWLQRSVPMATTTRPSEARKALREFDRREDVVLRDWLRRYVHLLLNVS
jgi:hypothetical protein